MKNRVRLLGVAGVILVLGFSASAAQAAWTTYRGNASRVGVDVSSSGSLPISQAWASSTLSGDIYGEPLVYGGQVIVATEGNVVYALNESTGHVTWHATAGTPVPAGQLPCGNISPNVGITSTPVVDPATGRVFVVADTWDGSHANTIAHRLYAFNLADGSLVSGDPVNVDPPGSIPADQLQRTALALDDGKIFIGYGGNDGDCGT